MRRLFRRGILIMSALLLVLVLLHWQAPAIGVAVLGFPVLLGTSLWAAGVSGGRARRTLIATAGTGAALAIMWAMATGYWVAHHYGVGFLSGMAGGPNSASLGVPVGAVLLMVAPAALTRLVDDGTSGVVEGLRVGVVGATSFGVAATVLRLAPQLATGVAAPHRPVEGLLIEAGIRGIVIPITSAAIGGIAGVALWFTRGRVAVGRRRALATVAVLAMIALASGTALADASGLGPRDELLVHVAVTLIALCGLRWSLHLALLHGRTGSSATDHCATCPECGDPDQTGAFCSNCGIARAAVPTVPDTARRPRGAAVRFGAGLTTAAVGATVISMAVTRPVAIYACPPECGSPPTGIAVTSNPRFTAAGGEFTVAYPSEEAGFSATPADDGVTARPLGGDGGTLRLFGEPAAGRDAERVVHDFLARTAPNASPAYVIPSVLVGYRPGFGQVDDIYPISVTGSYIRLRAVTVAAVKDDYALIAAAVGPFHQFGPEFGPGPPSAVNLQLGLIMDSYVNTFRWRGDSRD